MCARAFRFILSFELTDAFSRLKQTLRQASRLRSSLNAFFKYQKFLYKIVNVAV